MKRSRLKLFKTTTLTISLIGVILILLTVVVAGYVLVSDLTNSVSNTVSTGSSYDNLTQLKSEYANVSQQYSKLDEQLGTTPDANVKSTFNNGKLKLSEVNSTLGSAQSDIEAGEPDDKVNNELNQARNELHEAEGIYNNITANR